VKNLEIEAIGYRGTSLWSIHEHSEERDGIGLGQQNIRALTRTADQDMNQMRRVSIDDLSPRNDAKLAR
jgi:hypothetical protein